MARTLKTFWSDFELTKDAPWPPLQASCRASFVVCTISRLHHRSPVLIHVWVCVHIALWSSCQVVYKPLFYSIWWQQVINIIISCCLEVSVINVTHSILLIKSFVSFLTGYLKVCSLLHVEYDTHQSTAIHFCICIIHHSIIAILFLHGTYICMAIILPLLSYI